MKSEYFCNLETGDIIGTERACSLESHLLLLAVNVGLIIVY